MLIKAASNILSIGSISLGQLLPSGHSSSIGRDMWYLIANYNGKTYNLGAGLNQECCALMMTAYYQCYDNKKVKIGLIRQSDLILRDIHQQNEFVKDYKRDHFMVAQLETQDVAGRFEC